MRLRTGVLAAALAAVLVLPVPARAQLLAQYTARLGAADHVTSSGTRLDTVAAILRQDRANLHRFGTPDPEDETDPVFVTAEARAGFERLVARGLVRPEVRRAIISATPLVRVSVYPTRVDVELLAP